MAFKVVTGPGSEPLTLQTAKDYLKVDFTEDDTLITSLIVAAREKIENHCNMGLISQIVSETFDEFPSGIDPIYLHRHPFGSVTSVTYLDETGTSQTLGTEIYTSAGHGMQTRIGRKAGKSWPVTASEIGAVTVTYTIGYANADSVPEAIKAAMLLMIGQWYEKREDSVRKLPTQAEWLLEQYQVMTVS